MINNKFIEKLKTDVSDFCIWALTEDFKTLSEMFRGENESDFNKIVNMQELEMEHFNDLLETVKNLGITNKEFYQGLNEQAVQYILNNKGIGLHIKQEIKEDLINAITNYSLPPNTTSIYQLEDKLQNKVAIYINLVRECLINHNEDSNSFKNQNAFFEDKLSNKKYREYINKVHDKNTWLFKKLINYGKPTNLIDLIIGRDIICYNKDYENILIEEGIYKKQKFTADKLKDYLKSNNVDPLNYVMVNLGEFNNEFKTFEEYDIWAKNIDRASWRNFKGLLGIIIQNLELKQVNDDFMTLIKNNINCSVIDTDQIMKQSVLENISVVLKSKKFLPSLVEKKEFIPFLDYLDKNNILYKYLDSSISRARPEYISVDNNIVFFEHFNPLFNKYQNNTYVMSEEEQVAGAKSILNIYKSFKNHIINDLANSYKDSNEEDKTFWSKSLYTKTQEFSVYESYLYQLCFYFCKNKDLFLTTFKNDLHNLTTCINEYNKGIETSVAMVGENIRICENSNILNFEEKALIKENFKNDIKFYIEDKVNIFIDNFGNINSRRYEKEVKIMFSVIVKLMKQSKEYDLCDEYLNKQIHIRKNNKIEEDKPLILELLHNANEEIIQDYLKNKKINSQITYKKKNILEWYVAQDVQTANTLILEMLKLIKEDDSYKEDIKNIVGKKQLTSLIDKLTIPNTDDVIDIFNNGEKAIKSIKSNYYLLLLELEPNKTLDEQNTKKVRKNKI